MSNPRHRPDIDGLRAVAVLAVLVFHAFPALLPGGFAGVDVFFVISGYLISGILYRQLEAGQYSLADFYLRRVRRIFPALLAMLFTVLVWGRWGLFQDEFEQLGKHVAASASFLQNHVFRGEAGYFDREAFSKPLLHLWSLAVEEQFYLGCPLLLAWAWGNLARIRILGWGVMGVSLAWSLAAAAGWVKVEFFLLPQRAWELGAGACLAWSEWKRHGPMPATSAWRQAGGWVGVALLIASFFGLRENSIYPGVWALLPVAGTLLLIRAGEQAWLNRRWIGSVPAVWVGRISYPLYLFHWPALVWVHLVTEGAPRTSHLWAALGASAVLALGTYQFLERPFRRTESWRVAGALAGCLALLGGGGLVLWSGTGIRAASHTGSRNDSILKVERAIRDNRMLEGLQKIRGKAHVTRIPGGGPQTLFYGDSHVEQWAPRIVSLLGKPGPDSRGAVFVTEGGCPPIPGVIHQTNPRTVELGREFEQVLAAEPGVDRVVLGGRWGLYFLTSAHDYSIAGNPLNRDPGREAAFLALSKFVGRLSGKYQVFLLLDSPTGARLDPKNLRFVRGFWGIRDGVKRKLTVQQHLAQEGWIRERLQRIAREHGATVIDPLPFLTEGENCLAEDENGPVRYDNSHLRPAFVRARATWMDQTVLPAGP
jgi:peptidoglycan/LPS O-acetylase OafA/YrhL